MGYNFTVPDGKHMRVIIDTDAKCEADDQYAIVHALLTPKLDICGVIGAQFGKRSCSEPARASADECRRLLSIMDRHDIFVCEGANDPVHSTDDYQMSEGAELIIREAHANDPRPLFVVLQGPLTDLACALLAAPDIEDKFTAVWIGGDAYPRGGWEFNLSNDVEAARIIMDSHIELWQVPQNVYKRMLVSLAELEAKVRPFGGIGRYLFDQLNQKNAAMNRGPWPAGESWQLGDSPVVGLLLDPMVYLSEQRSAPLIADDLTYSFDDSCRMIRVYNDIDSRFILEDLFAKLKLTYGG